MTETKGKKRVQIFQVPEGDDSAGGCGSGAGGCGPADTGSFGGCGCGAPAVGLDEMIAEFSRNHGDRAEIKLADYSSDEAVSETLDALNRVLEKSHEKLKITRDNLEMVLTQSAPIIAVDGKIVSTRNVPSADQLAGVLDGELTDIPATSGCC